ncbi:MAG TPA: helical backbone metal receptor [Thermoanaerobaculia bacterium]
MRAVSLVPSLTETLFALGAGDDVVGITDFCIFPENLDRPRVGGTKTPRIERIRELRPDVVYVNVEENLKKHAEEIAEFARVVATEPKTTGDVITLIEMLGANHRRQERAQELIDQLRTANCEPRTSFTFVVPIWKKPWMWCGGDTYVSNLVESVGGRNLLREQLRYPTIAIENVLALKPDIVFLPDEPYAFTKEDAHSLRTRVIGPFPGHLFTWHGVRTIEGLKFLTQALRSLRPTA